MQPPIDFTGNCDILVVLRHLTQTCIFNYLWLVLYVSPYPFLSFIIIY